MNDIYANQHDIQATGTDDDANANQMYDTHTGLRKMSPELSNYRTAKTQKCRRFYNDKVQ